MTPDSVFSGTTLLNPLRVYLPGVLLSTVLLAAGSLLLVRSWLELGRALRGRWEEHGRLVARAARSGAVPRHKTPPRRPSGGVFHFRRAGAGRKKPAWKAHPAVVPAGQA